LITDRPGNFPGGNDIDFLALVAKGMKCLKNVSENPVGVPDRAIVEIDGKITRTARKTLFMVSEIISGSAFENIQDKKVKEPEI
jgi:hypothetical protein